MVWGVCVLVRPWMRIKFIILTLLKEMNGEIREETEKNNIKSYQTIGCQKDYLVSIVILVVPSGRHETKLSLVC